MNLVHHTYNDFHLGDNLTHLHFLRGMAKKYDGHIFIHAVQECHVEQLREYVADMPRIEVVTLERKHPEAINSWKNADGYFEKSPLRNDYWAFHLEWFRHLALKMELQTSHDVARDLLMCCPTLFQEPRFPQRSWNFFVINSRPCSGQLLAYDSVDYLDPLLRNLVRAGYTVLCTQKTGVEGVDCTEDLCNTRLSLVEIGIASLFCQHHIMVSTGPSWLALNQINLRDGKDGLRLMMIGCGERLDTCGLGIEQVADLPAVMELLQSRRYL